MPVVPPLQRPCRRIAQQRSSRKRNRSIPRWHQKSLARMHVLPKSLQVVLPQCTVNLAQRFRALHPRLTLPEQHKTLSTHTATGLDGAFTALAQYLHLGLSLVSSPGISRPHLESTSISTPATFPVQGLPALFRAIPLSPFRPPTLHLQGMRHLIPLLTHHLLDGQPQTRLS